MSKLISFASFAALLLTAGLAHATDCPGSNGNGCSWTCSNGIYHVTCQNTAVGGMVPRCYDVDMGSGTSTSVPCDQAPPPPGDIDAVDAALELIGDIEANFQLLEEELSCYQEAEEAEQAPAQAY